jgi:DNA-cytosine methyltransferase
MNVLSLFDGISCGRVALERAGIKVDNYYASEIKKSAIKCAKENYPNTIHIGDVTKVKYEDGILYTENGDFNVGQIDILIGGSPCQNFSILNVCGPSGEILGLEGEKLKLFYEYLRFKNEVNPKFFLLENVKMKKDSEEQLNEYLNCSGFHINSKLLTFQSRPRIY